MTSFSIFHKRARKKSTFWRISSKNLLQDKMNNHGSFFISSAYGSSKQLNIFVKVSPEKLWQALDWHVGLHKLNNVSNSLIIITAGPEEGRVHESSQHTDGWRREASLWDRNCCAAIWITKIMTSLSGVIAIQCRKVTYNSVRD